ncbi:hypothetical protein ACFW04_012120 [Cataglyphis niger]
MIISLQSTIGIAKMLFKDNHFKFLMTYKLSQDHFEIFFSAIRSRGGFNNNPTAWEFKSALKRLMAKADVRILHNANCHILDDTKLVISDKILEERSEEILDETNLFFQEHDYCINFETNLSKYAYEVIMYIAGFVPKSIAKHLRCTNCKKYLTGRKTLNCKSKNVEELLLMLHLICNKKKCNLHILCLKTFKNINSSIFSSKDYLNHILEQTYLENHRHQLIKLIIEKYLIVRLNHIAKAKNDAAKRIRPIHSRLIIFKNQ